MAVFDNKSMEVFLNFCDEGTGKNFTGHLNKALTDSGISTFLPTQQQHQPSDIQRAIEGCDVFIAVFSRNYASSFFCLDHLSYLLSLSKRERLILPVFYTVEPSHVRWQMGPFEEAFVDHKIKSGLAEEIMQKWRSSLKEVADFNGWNMKDFRTEAKLVNKIVKHVSMEVVRKTPLHVADHPIGLDSRVADVMRLLDLNTNDTQMIGIHGMGGIGKTTLAKAVFNHIKSSFTSSCFLSDIREKSENISGVVTLQKQLLNDLFNEEDTNINDVHKGINVIKSRIGSKKILVVLDDVSDHNQLEKLVGKRDWHCQGSRIIITTRDEHVLNVHDRVRNHHIYKLEGLNDTESLQLFSWHAFRRDEPMQQYVKLSIDVVSTLGGLPLALEVLGSYLWDQTTIQAWEDTVTDLKKVPNNDVMLKLKISYDGLNEKEKQIFLDIACFFIGENKDYAIDIWKGCRLPASNSINRLLQRCLIKIDGGKCLRMHDQIHAMGRCIVELENLDDPGSRSRLWDQDVIFDMLKNHKGTSKVRSLMLKGNGQEQSLETEAFKSMTNLKLLSISDACLIGSLKYLSSELMWLKCPLRSLPDDFRLEKLIYLDLSKSDAVFDLSNGNNKQLFPKLKILKLTSCRNLKRIPNCSLYPNLEKMILEFCSKLVEIPDSIGVLRNLVSLNLQHCSSLKKLPDSLGSLTKLEELDVSFDSNNYGQLKELPKNLGSLISLRTLKIGFNTSLTRLPSTFSGLCSLEELDARPCNLQGMIPDDFEKLSSLRNLNVSENVLMRDHSQLENMDISGCKLLVTIPELPTSLVHLDAFGCVNLQSMPKLSHLSKLHTLWISNCLQLVAIPELPTSVEYLEASGCVNLKTMPKLSHLSKLRALVICNCEQLIAIPELPTSLTIMRAFGCKRLQTLPKLSHLSKLVDLQLSTSNHLVAFPDLPTNLWYLGVIKWKCLQTLPRLSHISNLKCLQVFDCGELLTIEDLPIALETLDASYCPSLQTIPNLSHLSQLHMLKLINCKRLSEIHGLSGLKSLSTLHLSGCNPQVLRRQRLEKEMFTPLRSLCVPGSKVPNWFTHKWTMQDTTENPDWYMKQTVSCIVPRVSEEGGLHFRQIMVCLVVYSSDFRFTHPSHRVTLSLKREGTEVYRVSFTNFTGSHGNHMYFHLVELGRGDMPLLDPMVGGDQIELVNESENWKGKIEAKNELGPSMTSLCFLLKEAGIHFVYKPEDTKDSISEKLADFINSLYLQ
ncbi:TMV resistance protein N-like isoform X1 [Amborella trichopoda]|nr:TMV resistance protein N-like isoform X1 [Amborella trichopoda]|eukprot:XP_020528886.1 TMV resistance protein N-like isoform X1 [Amborella trichopoda]